MGSITRSFANNITTAGKFDGTKLTGDIPEANLSANAPAFDDNKIVNDISTLALKEATTANRAASNTNSQYVDVFQDSTGVTSLTNTSRSDSEYVSSSTGSPQYYYQGASDKWNFTAPAGYGANQAHTICAWVKSADGNDFTNQGSQGESIIAYEKTNGYQSTFGIGGGGGNNGKVCFHTPGESNRDATNTLQAEGGSVTDWVFIFGRSTSDFQTSNVTLGHADRTDTSLTTHSAGGGGTTNGAWTTNGTGRLFYHTSNSYTTAFHQEQTAHIGFWNEALTDAEILALHNSGQVFDWSTNNGNYTSSANLVDYFKFDETDYASGSGTTLYNGGSNSNNATKQSGSGSWGSATPISGFSFNATGNFQCNTITAGSSTSKMGAVITYQDNAGTNALNTDIILQLSADNGSNFTTATLTALPDFSSGIKMAKVNDLAVTAGTQLKYKILFANQAQGSKEARIRGVSLNY